MKSKHSQPILISGIALFDLVTLADPEGETQWCVLLSFAFLGAYYISCRKGWISFKTESVLSTLFCLTLLAELILKYKESRIVSSFFIILFGIFHPVAVAGGVLNRILHPFLSILLMLILIFSVVIRGFGKKNGSDS